MMKHTKRYLARLIKELRIIAPILLIIVLAINFSASKSEFQVAKEQLLTKDDQETKIFITDKLLENNQIKEVRQILGENATREIEIQPNIVQANITNWQELANNFPNYRDADLKLAILNWKIYRMFDAKKYLELALKVDPNSELAKKLMVLIR